LNIEQGILNVEVADAGVITIGVQKIFTQSRKDEK